MRTAPDATVTRIFVPAMDCPDEEREIRAALSRLPGVESLEFHLFSRQVVVRHRGDAEPLLHALRRIGLEGHPSDRAHRTTFLLSGAALLLGTALRTFFPGEPLGRLPFLAAILLGGVPVAIRGLREAR